MEWVPFCEPRPRLRPRRETGKSKGIALVQFVDAEAAVAAHAAEDAKPFQGRLLHILPGHRPPPSRVAADAEVCLALEQLHT